MKIYDKNGVILAFIVNANKNEQAKNFYTENNLDMQVASFNLKKGENIDRHYHYKQNRNIQTTSEVIYVQEGNLEIEIYDNEKNFVDKLSASEGMIIIIFDGGHAINIIEDSKFIEIKQNWYF